MTDKDKIKKLEEKLALRDRQLDDAMEKIEGLERRAAEKAEEERATAARRVWEKIQKGQLHWQEV